MTITKEMYKRNLIINVEDGVNDDGSTKYKARTFSGIKTTAEAAALHSAGTALASLMDGDASGVAVYEKSELVEE